MTGCNNEKLRLRKEMISLRKSKDKQLVENMGKEIVSVITGMTEYMESDIILMYYPVRNEADIRGLFDISLKAGKQVAMPKVLDENTMEFYMVSSYEDMEKGYMGIYEPKESMKPYTKEKNKKALIIVPGVAFDNAGGRIGMGGGYYDRYLKKHPEIKTCGVCGEYQLADKVPMDENDIYLNYIVTEKKIIKAEKQEAPIWN